MAIMNHHTGDWCKGRDTASNRAWPWSCRSMHIASPRVCISSMSLQAGTLALALSLYIAVSAEKPSSVQPHNLRVFSTLLSEWLLPAPWKDSQACFTTKTDAGRRLGWRGTRKLLTYRIRCSGCRADSLRTNSKQWEMRGLSGYDASLHINICVAGLDIVNECPHKVTLTGRSVRPAILTFQAATAVRRGLLGDSWMSTTKSSEPAMCCCADASSIAAR